MNTLEQAEIDLLRSKGFEFTTTFFGKEKVWRTKKMSLSRLLDLSNVYVKIEVNEDVLDSGTMKEFITENYNSVRKNAKKAAYAIAISVSDSSIVRFFLAKHFLRSLDNQELNEIAQKLFKQADYQNFMHSITLMNGSRITKPQVIEKPKA